jgi:hypothetical protein
VTGELRGKWRGKLAGGGGGSWRGGGGGWRGKLVGEVGGGDWSGRLAGDWRGRAGGNFFSQLPQVT